MTCAEFQEAVAAYALGALDPDEKNACDAHLSDADARHQGCREALDQARAMADRLVLEPVPIRPPPSLWTAIEEAIRSLPRDAASPAPPFAATTKPSRARLAPGPWPWLVAASLAIGFSWAGVSLRRAATDLSASQSRLAAAEQKIETFAAEAAARKQCERDLAALRVDSERRAEAVAMLMRGSVRVVPLAAQPGAPSGLRATALVDLPSHSGMVMLDGLVPATDRDYELWVIRGSEKKPAGLLRAGEPLLARIDPALLTDGADAFAVTLEPAGGSLAPRGPVLLVGAMPRI